MHAEMTTQQAANILNVSRPFLIKLLESGELPFTKVGTHRRIRFEDLMEYKRRLAEQSAEAMNELARQVQSLPRTRSGDDDMGY